MMEDAIQGARELLETLRTKCRSGILDPARRFQTRAAELAVDAEEKRGAAGARRDEIRQGCTSRTIVETAAREDEVRKTEEYAYRQDRVAPALRDVRHAGEGAASDGKRLGGVARRADGVTCDVAGHNRYLSRAEKRVERLEEETNDLIVHSRAARGLLTRTWNSLEALIREAGP